LITFEKRAEEMGLSYDEEGEIFSYSDDLSHIVYRPLHTPLHPGGVQTHNTDNFYIPYYAVFTRPSDSPEDTDYTYIGIVSRAYRFIGNRTLINKVRDSIESVGLPIIRENNLASWDQSRLRSEIVIQSGVNAPQVGDILPVMIINNSYNGTRSQSIQFGLDMDYNATRLTYGFQLGEMKEVHIAGAQTYVSSSAQEYAQNFPQHVTEMISSSFNKTLTEDELFSTLAVLEKIGKKRRDEVSKLLADMSPNVPEGQDPPMPSSWQVFLAIVRYCSFEPNLNIRSLLENAAESVLVIPMRMMELLSRLERESRITN